MKRTHDWDLVGTINSDDEVEDLDNDEDSQGPTLVTANSDGVARTGAQQVKIKKSKKPKADDSKLASDFVFDDGGDGAGDTTDGWQLDESAVVSRSTQVDIDDLIRKRKHGATMAGRVPAETNDGFHAFSEDDQEARESSEEEEADEDDDEDRSDDVQSRRSEAGSSAKGSVGIQSHTEESTSDEAVSDRGAESDADDSDEEERLKREAFFAAPEPEARGISDFQHMNLSRPIIRALANMGFAKATPIQARAIPVALLGKDIVGGAVTGSGKTAAFMIPIVERLLFRPKKVPMTRVVVLCPTRELAMQCHAVAKKIALFTDIACALVVGGLSLKVQEAELKTRPDVVIATPGRFIDHVRNSQGFSVESVEIMVMDEADRMLEDGFSDELNEIIQLCPKSRQTMLFSATMTDKVDDLVRLSLNKPVRLMVDAKKSTAEHLVQEFVRIRPQREHTRSAILLYLCENVFRRRVIVFFRSKVLAHRLRVVFGLLGLKAGELHGNMSQEQRINALNGFRDGKIDFLMATDLASRGLDIKGIDFVINFEAPQSHEIYLHRVGRTARAGRSGRSCTLAGEADRKVVKAAVRSSTSVKSRTMDVAVIDQTVDRLKTLDAEVEEVLVDEKEERQMRQAEMEIRKGENRVKHEDEIMSRPRRTWFQDQDAKQHAKQRGAAVLNTSDARPTPPQGTRPVTNRDKKRLDARRDRKASMGKKKGASQRQR